MQAPTLQAQVRIYLDGSVLVTHSATEMGQGVNVKMAAIAAKELGVALSRIKIRDTSSSEVPNPPPTAASVGSDLRLGWVVLVVCLLSLVLFLHAAAVPCSMRAKRWGFRVFASHHH